MIEYKGKYGIVETRDSLGKKTESITTFAKRIEILEGDGIRTIVILKVFSIHINNKKYLKIIGIDVITASIVLIIDTNGKEYGAHSYNESMLKLKSNTVIKATFKYTLLDNYANVLRITSDYSIIGESDIIKLKSKYYGLHYNNFINSFTEIDELLKLYKDKEFYTFTHFTGTQLRKFKQRYQIKMGKYFINFSDDKNVSNFENLDFRGYALIVCRLYKSRPYFTIIEIWGGFLSGNKLTELKRNEKISNYFEKLCAMQFNIYNDEEMKSILQIDNSNLSNAFRYYELASECDQQYTNNYILDGSDDSYFEEWEDDYSDNDLNDLNDSQNNIPLFVEPGDWYGELDAEYYTPEEKDNETNEEFLNYEKSTEKEIFLCEVDEELKETSFKEKYKITSVTNEEFAIDLVKIEIPVDEADISEIPF